MRVLVLVDVLDDLLRLVEPLQQPVVVGVLLRRVLEQRLEQQRLAHQVLVRAHQPVLQVEPLGALVLLALAERALERLELHAALDPQTRVVDVVAVLLEHLEELGVPVEGGGRYRG